MLQGGALLSGRYCIEEFLGGGAMGEVYRAWDSDRAYRVAIKVLRAELSEDRYFVERFRREAEALARLQHRNIVRFYEVGQDGRLAFIVMDYVDGSPLRGRIHDADGPLPSDEILRILEQVCAALHYAHARGVVHRDIKPGNIMLQADGTVLLADFGIARTVDATTFTQATPGTPAYMSPEQCADGDVDARSDLYSLGVVLYEMATGRRPFLGDDPSTPGSSTTAKVRHQHQHQTPPRPRSVNSALPEAVERVILRCLAKKPEARYQGALEMLNDLRAALAPRTAPQAQPIPSPRVAPVTPVVARPPTVTPTPAVPATPPSAPPPVRRRPRWAWALPAVAGVLALAILLPSVLRHGDKPIPTATSTPVPTQVVALAPAVTSTVTPTPQPSATDTSSPTETPVASATPRPSETPSQTPPPTATNTRAPTVTLVAALSGGSSPPQTSTPVAAPSASATHRPRTADLVRSWELLETLDVGGGAWSAVYSPDGSRVAVGTNGGLLVLWDPNQGHELYRVQAHTEAIYDLAYSPDGQTIATASSDGTLQLRAAPSGEILRTLDAGAAWVGAVTFSPDSALLAAGDSYAARTWRVSDGSPLLTLDHAQGVTSVAFSPDGALLATAGADEVARLWRVSDGRLEQNLVGHGNDLTQICFSADGTMVATAFQDNSVRLWRTSDGTPLKSLSGGDLRCVAFAPDSTAVATGANNARIYVWDTADGSLIRTLDGSQLLIGSVTFSPDGARALAAAGKVHIWGTAAR